MQSYRSKKGLLGTQSKVTSPCHKNIQISNFSLRPHPVNSMYCDTESFYFFQFNNLGTSAIWYKKEKQEYFR